MTNNPTCEERIGSELKYELDLARDFLDSDYGDETHEEYSERFIEFTPRYLVVRVGISYGGPADGYDVYLDPQDKTIERIDYYFQDWFDGARRTLTGPDFDTVRDALESVFCFEVL